MAEQASSPLPWTTIELPSRGVLYGGRLPDGAVQIRKSSMYEMQTVREAGGDGIGIAEKIFATFTKLPDGIKHEELLVTDRLALLIYQRVHNYGPMLTVNFLCKFCGKGNTSKVDMAADFNEQVAEPDLCEPFVVLLPDAKVPVGIRFRRGTDERMSLTRLKRKRLEAERSDRDEEKAANIDQTEALADMLVAINGEDVGSNALKRRDFARSISAADEVFLASAIDKAEPGIDMRVLKNCRTCSGENRVEVALTAEFFRPGAV
mgnify:CR=1 FL=1